MLSRLFTSFSFPLPTRRVGGVLLETFLLSYTHILRTFRLRTPETVVVKIIGICYSQSSLMINKNIRSKATMAKR